MYLLGQDDSWKREINETARSNRRAVKTIRTTTIEPYLADYMFFTCAPLYYYAGVNYSIPDQFEAEAGPQDRILVDYQRTVIGGMEQWGNFLEGLSREVWDDFCHYVSTLMFISKPKEIVWTVRSHDIVIEGTQVDVVSTQQLPVRARVFLPDGNRGRLQVRGGYPAKLWWEDPHYSIVTMAERVLTRGGQLET